jgi:hypothetical protein
MEGQKEFEFEKSQELKRFKMSGNSAITYSNFQNIPEKITEIQGLQEHSEQNLFSPLIYKDFKQEISEIVENKENQKESTYYEETNFYKQ